METRNRFRPSAWDALEERVVMSHANPLIDTFGTAHALCRDIHEERQTSRPVVTVGALGDSYTDEYRFSPPATTAQTHARNWVEILAATRGVNFGPFSTRSRGEPRNQGFAFNWARAGATSNDMVQFELPGLTAQVARGQVKYVSIFIGGNDLGDFASGVATGAIPVAQAPAVLTQTVTTMIQNFETAVGTLLAANPNVKLVVWTLPDITIQPIIANALKAAGPEGQLLASGLSQATQQYNAVITGTAQANPQRVAVLDLAGIASGIVNSNPSGLAPFDGTTINLATPGDNYHNFFLADGIHVGTVAQGIIADAFVNAVDSQFGLHIRPLTPEQIVRFAAHVRPSTP